MLGPPPVPHGWVRPSEMPHKVETIASQTHQLTHETTPHAPPELNPRRHDSMVHNKNGRKLNTQMRRKLSEEGKKLLRRALELEENTEFDVGSVESSVVATRDEESDSSDLDVNEQDQATETRDKRRGGGGAAAVGARYEVAGRNLDEGLDKAMEDLTEKRDTTKIEALKKILSILCANVMTERLNSRKVTLTANIVSCLKKRMKESGTLSLRALGVLAITLGNDQAEFYQDIELPLQRIITDKCNPALRVEAVYSLSIAVFLCCNEDQRIWETMDLLGSVLVNAEKASTKGGQVVISSTKEDDDEDEEDREHLACVLMAVIECWCFLVSFFRPSMIVPKILDPKENLHDHVVALASFVRDGVNSSVRSAACEALAFVVQYKYLNDKTWSFAVECDDSCLSGLDLKIEKFMKETGKNIGKKNRKMQRSMLKDVLETLRSGEGPHQDLQIEDETLSIHTWSRFFQANVFRRSLLSGFQVHLFENEVLRRVFDVRENTNVKVGLISTVKRRADHKSRSMGRRNSITRKENARNAFLFEQDDE